MGGGSTTQTENKDTSPWAPQQPYLLNAFQTAQNALNTNMAAGPYGGNYVAAPNSNQYSAANGVYNWASGAGQGALSSILGNSGNLTNTGYNAAGGALSGLSGLTGDNTSRIIGDATQYANNPAIPGMVQAAMASANQEAADNTLPNLYRSAAASGNINSDRTAIAQGVVDRGLAQQAGNIAANLEGNAYNTGISSALQGNAQNLQALSQLGALGSNMGNTGLNSYSTAINDAGALGNQAMTGANQGQTLDQSVLNNALAKYNGTTNFPWQQLQNYMGIVGGNYGSQSTGTTTQTNNPGMMSNIGMGLGILGALF